MINAFLTGSHAYGWPNKDSDVDVCIRIDPADAKVLSDLLKPRETTGAATEPTEGSVAGAVKSGLLNLIMCTDDATFEAWRSATEMLVARGPVTRDDAIALIKSRLDATGDKDNATNEDNNST